MHVIEPKECSVRDGLQDVHVIEPESKLLVHCLSRDFRFLKFGLVLSNGKTDFFHCLLRDNIYIPKDALIT